MAKLEDILQLKANFGKAGLIHVKEEEYPLANIAIDKIRAKISDYERHYFNIEKNFDINEIKSILINGSLFNPLNYIELNFKGKPLIDEQNKLLELINLADNNTFILICCNQLTKRELSSNFVNQINQNGFVLEITEYDVKIILQHIFNEHNLTITGEALSLLIEQNQANHTQLIQEANKLILAIPHDTIVGVKEIEQLTADNAKYNIYQLSNSYLSGDLALSIKILDNLMQNTEDAILINWILSDDLKKLLRIKSALNSSPNKTVQQISRDLRLWGSSLDKLPSANKRLNYKTLLELYQELARIDLIIKGIDTGDVKLILTRVITKICTD